MAWQRVMLSGEMLLLRLVQFEVVCIAFSLAFSELEHGRYIHVEVNVLLRCGKLHLRLIHFKVVCLAFNVAFNE